MQKDRQTEMQINNRQIDKQTDKHINKQIYRQIERQKNDIYIYTDDRYADNRQTDRKINIDSGRQIDS